MNDRPRTRRFPRIPAEHAILVRRIGGEAAEALAKTRVVGLGGCMFVHEERFGVGVPVELLISVGLKVVRALARIVYELPVDGEHFEIGVEFVDIAAEDRAVVESLFPRTRVVS